MKNYFRIILLALLVFGSFQTTSIALETEIIKDEEKWFEKQSTLDWKNFEEKEFMAPVEGAGGSIKIDSSEIFLTGNDVNQYSYWTWGYPDYSLMLIRSGADTIYVEHEGGGYVSIDDWKNVDANAMIKELNDNAKKIAQDRKAKNISYATNLSWVHKPQLDRQKNMVYYAYKVEWSDDNLSLESLSLVLGKRGYTTVTFVTNYDKNISLAAVSKRNKDKASTFIYDEGKMYSDFKVALGDIIVGFLAPIQKKYAEIINDKAYLESVLSKGAENAYYRARKTLAKVYRKVGFIPNKSGS